jgi:hypothetical protein
VKCNFFSPNQKIQDGGDIRVGLKSNFLLQEFPKVQSDLLYDDICSTKLAKIVILLYFSYKSLGRS